MQLTMITGDNPLTACHVARELRLTRREIVVLSPPESTNNHGIVTFDVVSVDYYYFHIISPNTSVHERFTDIFGLLILFGVHSSLYSRKRVALATSGPVVQSSHHSLGRYQGTDF